MHRRRSFGSAEAGQHLPLHGGPPPQNRARGSAINYPGKLRFRRQFAFKAISASEEMDQRIRILVSHTLLITDDGPMAVRLREEVKDLIHLQFGISKHGFSVYRNNPGPFLAIFHEARDRDVLFVVGRVVEGPVELGFHALDLDRDGTREIIPFNVKVCLEGLPSHAWYREVAKKALCDEAVIYHVDQETINRVDQRTYDC
jgi:hypothetical protein